MDQCEDREEGVPPSKSTLCGEHESQTKAQRKKRGTKRKHEPEPSFVSLKSDWSAHRPINFKVQPVSAAERNQRGTKRKHEPEPRKCDRSRSPPIEFKVQPVSAAERGQRSQSAGSSCPSVRSDYSKEPPPAFSAEPGPTRVKPAGVRWLRPGLRKYSCQLTIDTNTVHRNLQLSDNNRKVTNVEEIQSYPDHPDRFYVCEQLLCRNGLTGRCYWEVEWRGNVSISVSYRSIRRKGNTDCLFGHNDQSWSLECTDDGPVRVWHDNIKTYISSSSSSASNRAAVYVDCPAGTLSFYRVSSDTLIHLHTFNTTFTQTLYPGIGVGSDILKFFSGKFSGASVSLC